MGLVAATIGAGVLGVGGSALSASAASSAAGRQADAAKSAAQMQSDAAVKGAQIQADASNRAADLQQTQYQQSRADLEPYRTQGSNALLQASNTTPFNFNPTQAALEATPGYQFTLQQGLRGVQASAAARGLGSSGAALRGAADYTTGLADTTFGDQFSRALTTYGTNLSRLLSLGSFGESAASQTGNIGATLAGNAGNALIGGANARAAGITGAANAGAAGLVGAANAGAAGQVGVANAFGSGLGSLGSTLLLSRLLQGGAGAGGAGTIYQDQGALDELKGLY